MSRTVRVLLALASGVALAMAYPLFNVPILGWIAPALLIVAVIGERPRFAIVLGLVQGAAFYGLSLPWFYNVMRQYGPMPVIQAAGVFALVILVMSIFHAVFAALIAWLGKTSVGRACFAAPFLWVTLEFASMYMPAIGFPWNLLGYVAAGNLAFVQITAVTGIFGLSLLVAAYNGLAAWTFLQFSTDKKTQWKPLAGITAALILIALAGPPLVPTVAGNHVAHLVQTNFPVSNGYPSDWMQTHAREMDQLEQISIVAAQETPGIVVWPEVPAPFSL
ncbi:MAG TPA: hypothetical protein VFE02_14980, partial [Candidatus Acidoferrales bacterium]|nr:hypothetical protein [Candidatus Acidoferrales bacterium]